VVKFAFSNSKQRKQPFFAEIFKIQRGALCPPAPFVAPMSVITGKENASKDWNCIILMFPTSFNIYFVFGYACFRCIMP